MSGKITAEREEITFESGYEELKGIVERLSGEDVPVHEMFEGFRRGKGLEQALRGYLTAREGELAEIEQGKNLPEFDIVAPSASDQRAAASGAIDAADMVFEPAASTPSAPAVGVDHDDIPF